MTFQNSLQLELKTFSYFECHKLVIRLWRPGINFNTVFECNNKEFNTFIFDNFKMNCSLEVTDIDPSIASFNLLLEIPNKKNCEYKLR